MTPAAAAQPRNGGADGTVVGGDGLARPPWAAVDPLLREYYDS
ncbi:MAG: DNA-3-methyladenine glycosylase I, partial [Actinomycetota bacterium]|nr:DNA-3-methyladenine glycosylase I [Actinomycetota bacterium]